jgi:hypothetical protein
MGIEIEKQLLFWVRETMQLLEFQNKANIYVRHVFVEVFMHKEIGATKKGVTFLVHLTAYC